MSELYNTFTLENGLRIIHLSSPTNVAYCGISIDAGTRDELSSEFGMAHFCEHLMFKGTKHRKAWHIINRMESVGGDLNAYTNKEETVVYAAFLKEHLARAIELIADIVFHSTYPQSEIDKEREVIVDEIESYNDSPSELIFDKFENIIYENRDLGHDILGSPENVRSFSSQNAKDFVSRLYRPQKMVLFVFGNVNFKDVIKYAGKYAGNAEGTNCIKDGVEDSKSEEERNDAPPLCESAGMTIIENMNTHQAHVMIGCPAYPSDSNKRIAMYFLNNIIGGPGMNSRLNIALRERKGLVYTVESSLTNYTDTSTFAIYFGCDTEDIEKCLKLVRKELDILMAAPLSERQFTAYMKQIEGQIGVACDNFENYALDMAKCFLHYNKFEGMEDTYAHLHKVTPKLLHEVAREIFSADRLVTLIFK